MPTVTERASTREPLEGMHPPDRRRGPGFSVVEELIEQLSDVIYGLASHRPAPADGIGWVSFDAAICGLHSALVAMEEFGGVDTPSRLRRAAISSS